MKKSILVFSLIVFLAGCGGSGNSTPSSSSNTPPPAINPVNVQGQWEAFAVSTVNPSNGEIINANLSQTGTSVFTGANEVVLLPASVSNGQFSVLAPMIVGGECDGISQQPEQDSIEGTFSSDTSMSYALLESGASFGSVTTTGTLTFQGVQQTLSGDYSVPAACGYSADTGTITGNFIPPFSGAYAGMIEDESTSQSDAVVVTISQDQNYNVTISGTDNGAPVSLTGDVVGAFLQVSGTDASSSVSFFGLKSGEEIMIFDGGHNYIGSLSPGTNPEAAAVRFGKIVPKRED